MHQRALGSTSALPPGLSPHSDLASPCPPEPQFPCLGLSSVGDSDFFPGTFSPCLSTRQTHDRCSVQVASCKKPSWTPPQCWGTCTFLGTHASIYSAPRGVGVIPGLLVRPSDSSANTSNSWQVRAWLTHLGPGRHLPLPSPTNRATGPGSPWAWMCHLLWVV